MSVLIDGITARVDGWLERLSYAIIGPLALLLAVAPVYPEPHLVETSRMLVGGELTEPIYIFDFLMHASGLVILGAKIARDIRSKNENDRRTHS